MSFMFQMRAAVVGDLDAEIAAGERRVQWAAQGALREYAEDLKGRLRADVRASGLKGSERLATTWRSKFYPNSGDDPAEVVFSKAPLIVRAFEHGAEIRARQGKFLAIPAPDVRFKAVKKGAASRSIVAAYEARYGKLRFVPLKGRNMALLVADVRKGRGAKGGYRKVTAAAQRRGDYESKVILFLVPVARLPRLLRGATIRGRVSTDFPRVYQRAFDRLLIQAETQGMGAIALPGTIGPNPAQAARMAAGLSPNAFAGVTW